MRYKSTKHGLNKWHMIVFICSIGLVIMLAGYVYYSYEENSIRETRHDEIKVIADMKISQITQWHKERVGDSKVISRSPYFMRAVKRWQQNKDELQLKREIIERFSMAKIEYGYKEILLVSPKGELLLSLDPKEKVDPVTFPIIIKAIQHQQITFTDFYLSPKDNKINYNIIAPVIDDEQNTIATLVFRIDPNEYLYPLVQSWPSPSKTSETLLIRKEGDSVLFLNELRHQKNTALNLKIPLTRKDVPAVQAVLGFIGTVEGVDYRGIPVLSYVEPVPDTPWFMIAKVDKNEIYAELRFRAVLIGLFTLVSILFLSVGLILLYNYRKKNIFQELFLKEKELRANQEEFKTTLFSIGDGIIKADVNGNIDYMNPVAVQLTGWKETETKGLPIDKIFRIINEDSRQTVDNPVTRVLQEGEIVILDSPTLLISKDGKEIPIENNGAPIKNESGEITGVVLVFRDITKRKRTEIALQKSESRLREAQKLAHLGSWFWDVKSGAVEWSDEVFHIFGLNPKEFTPQIDSILALSPWPEENQRDKELINQAIETKSPGSYEQKFLRPDKSIGHYHSTFQGNYDEKGDLISINGTVLDITKPKLAEAKLKESEEKFRLLVENQGEGIAITDEDNNFLFTNPAAENIFGVASGCLIHRNVEEFLTAEELDKMNKETAKRKNNEKSSYEIEICRADKQLRTILLTATPSYSSTNEFNGTFGIFRDITQRKEDEMELLLAKEHAEESDKLKTAFLQNISHEVRTPLNAILGFSGLLNAPEITFEDRKYFTDIIVQSSKQLLSIIDDIISISSIETGQEKILDDEININLIGKLIKEQYLTKASDKNITLSFNTSLPDDEAFIITDATKLTQILSNLVGNALKFTKQGYVNFGYSVKDSQLEFHVADSGIGIPLDMQDAIFNRFCQVETTSMKEYGGSGLGLSISKSYTELLGGRMWLTSELGLGSVFYISIPYKKANMKIKEGI